MYGALLGVQVLFGLWPVAGAAVLDELSPRALVAFRLAAGAPLLAVLGGLPWRRLPSPGDLLRLAALGACGISLNQLLYVEGLALAGPVNAGVAVVAVPALALIVATVLGVERPRALRLVGVGVALTGAAVLVGVERLDVASDASIGTLAILGGAAAYAVFLVTARPVIARVGEAASVGWFYVLGAAVALPHLARDALAAPWGSLPASTLGALAFILVGPTALTYLLNAYALRRVESSVVAVFVCLQPVVAAGAAWQWLDAEITLRQLAAAAVVSLGVALASGVAGPRPVTATAQP